MIKSGTSETVSMPCVAMLLAMGAPALADSPPELPMNVYWGDMHLHTANSADAFAFGARLGPEQALRFARGEEVVSSTGLKAQLARPLDFLVIADHAEALGLMFETFQGNPVLVADPTMARWAQMMRAGRDESYRAALEIIQSAADRTLPPVISDPKLAGPIARSIWTAHTTTVERFNNPGTFTAFMGYEYSSLPGGDNLHRVVVFRDGKERVDTILPFSSLRSENPQDLWASLERYEKNTGGQVLAIPHNSNLSNGRMFAFVNFEGDAIDADYAARRARWEPLVEVTQIKGDSESHPFLSPNDEFAGFGDAGWELGNLTLQAAKTESMLGGDYVREALKRGLQIARETGVNPFKLGMIGSTDAHTALATGDEDNFFGKHPIDEPSAERSSARMKGHGGLQRVGWHYLAGGYAAVWARDNTREELFDAMLRREVYASTGPRITLRFFGGWDFVAEDVTKADFVASAYARGVPMGSDLLPPEPGDKAPAFVLRALRDPDGADLACVQIIKGWIDAGGQVYEKIFDVVTDKSGAPEFAAAWSDPEFDATVSAFYYLRVIEVPTRRWTAYDAERFGITLPDEARLSTQERAYSSPIWFTPAK
jgi:hypothetical protein